MMKSEERYLKENFGQHCPFKVPEGYFEDFASRMETMLPDMKQAATMVPINDLHHSAMRMWLKLSTAAACVCGLMVGVTALVESVRPGVPVQTANASYNISSSSTSMSAVDYMADYVMLDNSDIYAYVSSN